MTPQILAVADLVSGSRIFYTMAVGILVFGALIAGGWRAVATLMSGKMGAAIGWACAGALVAVIVASSYAIYLSMKHTSDRTGITTGQFGEQ